MKHPRNHAWYDRLPRLNHHSRKVISVVLPWFALGLGVMQIINAVAIWNVLGSTKTAVGLSSLMQEYYNGGPLGYSPIEKAVMYFAIALLALSAMFFIGAVEGLRARRRYAWKMVMWALWFNLIYGFTQYFIFGNNWQDVLKTVAESLALLYLLGQVHSYFTRVRGGHLVPAHQTHHGAQHHAAHPHAQQHPHPHAPQHPHAAHNPHIHVG